MANVFYMYDFFPKHSHGLHLRIISIRNVKSHVRI